ncbi:MAG: glucosaminidase domain-containing protein [Hyphomicrobiaceae bacterium]|nr:glucosaminidase domain-containing protein [Hyphomicrobiaceae bacterium]
MTPGRLLAFLKARNGELNPRYESVPGEYMRLGEALGVRWDYAFYQMVLETGALAFKSGGRAGDVKPTQNNFAGLGATGKGEPGESFPDIATGVQAHLEHLLLYSGQRLDNPVAERTRKVQQWGVLNQWQAGFTRPITYADLAAKWAPGSNVYSRMLESIAHSFQDFCRRPDPKPELLAAVRRSRLAAEQAPRAPAQEERREERPGNVLAQRAIDTGKAEEDNRRAGLVTTETVSPSLTASLGGKVPPTPFKILNSPPAQPEAPAAAQPTPSAWAGEPSPAFRSGMLNMPAPQKPPAFYGDSTSLPPPALPAASETQLPPTRTSAPEARPPVQPSAAAPPPAQQPPAQQAKSPPPAAPRKDPPPTKVASAATAAVVPPGQKCRVWTASYGGQKALIIRSVIDRVVNFTVLDVNEGAEKREADAFIAAYAKNGTVAGEFASQTNALDKAFELCPEG